MMVNSPPKNSQERNIQDPFRPLSPPQQTYPAPQQFRQNLYQAPPVNPYQQPPQQFQQQSYVPNYLKPSPTQNPFFQNPTPPTNQYYRVAPPPPPPGQNYSYKIEEPKAKDPTPFDGKKTYEATQFIRSCQLVFMLQPIRYAAERTKILYAISYLTDSPLSYFQTLLEQGNFDAWFPDWEAFKAHFMNHYGDPDAVRTADMKLRALKQTGSAAQYLATFLELSGKLAWNEPAYMSQFYIGLKKDIKDELAKDLNPPENFVDMQKKVVKLDNRMFNRKKELNFERTLTGPPPPPKNTLPPANNKPHTGATPMEIEAMKLEERDRLRKEGACFYCKEKGHMATSCPKKKKQASISSTTTTPPPPRPTGTITEEQGNDKSQ